MRASFIFGPCAATCRLPSNALTQKPEWGGIGLLRGPDTEQKYGLRQDLRRRRQPFARVPDVYLRIARRLKHKASFPVTARWADRASSSGPDEQRGLWLHHHAPSPGSGPEFPRLECHLQPQSPSFALGLQINLDNGSLKLTKALAIAGLHEAKGHSNLDQLCSTCGKLCQLL